MSSDSDSDFLEELRDSFRSRPSLIDSRADIASSGGLAAAEVGDDGFLEELLLSFRSRPSLLTAEDLVDDCPHPHEFVGVTIC